MWDGITYTFAKCLNVSVYFLYPLFDVLQYSKNGLPKQEAYAVKMTTHGNAFCITGPLWWNPLVTGGFPLIKRQLCWDLMLCLLLAWINCLKSSGVDVALWWHDAHVIFALLWFVVIHKTEITLIRKGCFTAAGWKQPWSICLNKHYKSISDIVSWRLMWYPVTLL